MECICGLVVTQEASKKKGRVQKGGGRDRKKQQETCMCVLCGLGGGGVSRAVRGL